jgi:alkyl sulfatase BDS1-like metallo-beta-lactamase superfamily hydrolase
VIGGTRFELLPARGGETSDAMLVHLPEQGVLFVGDILMPYLGAPFAEEGSVDGLIAAIDQVNALAPRVLLHGHEPLTRLFASTATLDQLRGPLVWLRAEVLRSIQGGAERGAIHAANLVPPTLAQSGADVHLAYLALRENVINRLYDQNTGYWQNGLQGLDALTSADYGAALVDYLGMSDTQLAAAAERLVADGKHEMAAQLLRWGEPQFAGNARLEAVKRLAYLRLMEKYQQFNPFKFILYAAQIDHVTPQMALPAAAPMQAAR